ncbi:SRPBCC family protein [Mycobacterium sp. CVI_P3]|uniref:SRPBCC family protein n=1 Tax=Mycobacterium pinniadriaticum TaxID=2994102 RepID=A0ABT3SME3_9MYCO|nr:SRPBCC family protein [Mycobacterium pinniadriaticum]MCX2934262.1 SRPBCC family protein [Mycobacterium pinniadriaticum]MCX2940700.1 SRPBCC family protein [Mycobacterium pinniadriaticum]
MPTQIRRIEVSGVINAPAELVFAFLARPDNHVALDTTGMIRSSADHRTLTELGTVFVMNMHNRMKGDHQVENHVICYEPRRAIGWAPAEPGEEPAGHTWTWRMTPLGPERTLVTETYDWSAFRHTDMLDHLPVADRSQMQESLQRLAEELGHRSEN